MKDYTAEVHGCHEFDATGALTTPVYLSATFRHPAFRQSTGYDYGRVANPTRTALEQAIALLEGGGRAWALSSGMAAINLVFALCKPGDHVLLPEDLYGGTVRLANDIYRRYGIAFEYIDQRNTALVRAKMRKETRIVFIETPSNPMMFITDIRALAEIAHEYGALLVADNTFCSPVLSNPLDLGADVVLHSTTKFINGHSDVVGGVVVSGTAGLGEQVQHWANALGLTGGAWDSWLTLRGLRTIDARMRVHEENTAAVVEQLADSDAVARVHYPGLPGHPGHALAARQQRGFGALLSFELAGGLDAVKAFSSDLRAIDLAESLGGTESLLAHPATMTHAGMTPQARAAAGITDSLLRLSVGIEPIADLRADLAAALERAARA